MLLFWWFYGGWVSMLAQSFGVLLIQLFDVCAFVIITGYLMLEYTNPFALDLLSKLKCRFSQVPLVVMRHFSF